MRINRKSWHYRLLRATEFDPSDNLCPYCRQVIAAIVLAIIFGAIGLAAIGLALGPFVQFFVEGDAAVWALLGGVGDIFVLSVLLSNVVSERRRRERIARRSQAVERDWAPRTPPKEPGLLRLWLRAKHEKVCPRLDFV